MGALIGHRAAPTIRKHTRSFDRPVLADDSPTAEGTEGEEEDDQLHAGGMRLDHADQGVPLPGLYLLVVEEFVGRMRPCSGRPAACQKALDW